jgi:hypothetical protein
MIEAQARNLEFAAGWKMNPIAADAGLAQFRWLMERRLLAEQTPNPADPKPAFSTEP